MSQEGPSAIVNQYLSCSGCKWHDQSMRRSGWNPEYDHYCKHPDAPKSKLSILYEPPWAWIGKSDHTPHWCPVTNPPAIGGPSC